MKTIKLSGKRAAEFNAYAIVDDDDHERLSCMGKWHLSDTGYAVRRSSGPTERMHRIVAGTPNGLVTDHLNHNRLDNRKRNLRVVTQAENMANCTGMGYCWDDSKQLWIVRYRGKFYGRYKTETEAIKAVKLARSGVKKVSHTHPRRSYLPRGVYFMQPEAQKKQRPYYVRPLVNGKRIFKGYFSSVAEAKDAYNQITSAKED